MGMSRRILLVEDNLLTAKGLSYSLEREGYAVEVAENVNAANTCLQMSNYDLILLDVGLPDGNGFDIAKTIADKKLTLPIIFLTARDDEADVLRGLELGATDYIIKPFHTKELMLKIRNLMQLGRSNDFKIMVGNLQVDTQKRQVTCGQQEIILTALEYRLLLCLLENVGTIVTRERLADEIWQASGKVVNDNTISVYIKRLRQKLGEDGMIRTVKNVGYILPNLQAESTVQDESQA